MFVKMYNLLIIMMRNELIMTFVEIVSFVRVYFINVCNIVSGNIIFTYKKRE